MKRPTLPRPDPSDLHFYGGLALLGWGCWQVAPWLAAVVVGAVLVLLVVPIRRLL